MIATRTPAKRLRFERQRRGWSCNQVAVELCRVAHACGEPTPGVNGHMVNRWERGVRRPSPFYVRLLCLLFDTPADELGLVAIRPGRLARVMAWLRGRRR